jgi:hypothetical protein
LARTELGRKEQIQDSSEATSRAEICGVGKGADEIIRASSTSGISLDTILSFLGDILP